MDLQEKLKEVEAGGWHDLPGSDAQFKIKQPKPLQISKFRRECRRPKSRQFPQGIDADKLSEMLVVECVIEWKNISMNGDAFECTEENKKFIYQEWLEFNNFIDDIIIKITSKGEQEHDEDLEN